MIQMGQLTKLFLSTALTAGIIAGLAAHANSAGFLDRLDIAHQEIQNEKVESIPPSFAGSFLSALSAGANGDDPAAIKNYRDAIKFDPENKLMKQSLFMALTADGQIADAVELLKTIPAEDQNTNVINIVVAANALKQKSWNKVLSNVDKISGSDLDNMVTNVVGAWALFGDRKLPEALERVNGITGPDWVMMIKEYHLGLLNAASGEDNQAIIHFQNAIDIKNVAGALTQTYMRAIEGLARAQYKVGDEKGAEQTIANGLELLINHPPLLTFEDGLSEAQKVSPLVKTAQQGGAEIFFNVGSAISRQGGLPFAQGYLQLSKFLAPKNDVTLIALGSTYSGRQNYVRANEFFSQISADSGFYRRAQQETALNLNRMEQVDEAVAILTKLVDEDPKDVITALSLGGIYGQHKKYEEAAALYDKVLENLGEPEARDWLIFYRRGIAHERTKQWPLAEADFKRALDLSPNQPDVLNYLGYSWIDQGINLDEGLAMIKKAVELKPNSGFIIDSLGWAYYRLERFDDAVVELTRALELMPSDPVINDHLGDAYWQTGRKLEAVFQWKHALSNNPAEEDKAKILEKLNSGLTH